MVSVLVTLPGTLAILVNVARLIPVTSLTSERVILRFSLVDVSCSCIISIGNAFLSLLRKVLLKRRQQLKVAPEIGRELG